uniref:7TM_GPCR_Srx domain-containing protein n=1 Tax=Parastrongyloides trichosuri TaxID=131310 RepID=A0A0N4ZYW2_PARTI
MVDFVDYISLAYLLVLTPIYVYFTVRLGWKIYYKKSPDLRNEFYPIIFFKGCVDNITNIVQLCTGRILKFNILESFFLSHDFPAYILYFTTATTYCLMYQINFLIAFNRYVAMLKPTRYKEIFEFKRLHLYMALMFIPSMSSAIPSVCFKLGYIWYPSLNRVLHMYFQSGIEYYNAIFGIVFNIPVILITSWMNLKCFLKNKKILSKKNLYNSMDSKLFLYNVIAFLTMWGFDFYYIGRYLPYILGELKVLEQIAITIIPWLLDIMTFGLWIFSMVLS